MKEKKMSETTDLDNFNYYPTLQYLPGDQLCPIPANERALQTITAKPFVEAVDHFGDLEGLHFNQGGSILYFCNCPDDKVMAVDMETKEVSTVLEVNQYIPDGYIAAVKVHKDGRLFVAYLTTSFTSGGIFYCDPDGSGFHDIEIAKGIRADDMIFDSEGNIYVTDMCGSPTLKTGTIEWISADLTTRETVLKNLACPNGIALSTDETILWITDTASGELIRTELTEDKKGAHPLGQSVVYHTTGYMGPDSIVVDDDDNVYNALYFQGRILVYNKYGFPIGQIFMPGRKEGRNLRTTHPCIRPGTNEIYICANDDVSKKACIFKAGSFAPANTHSFYLKGNRFYPSKERLPL